jgi:cell division septum initiation protein DivIVA
MAKWTTAAATLAVLGAGGCSTAEPAVCDSFAAVQNSLDHLRDANVSENGVTQLRADLTELRADLQQLYADAQAQFGGQVQAVRTAVNELTSSLSAARATPDGKTFEAVRTARAGLQTSVQSLGDAVSGTC